MPKYVLRAVFGRMQFTLHTTRRTPHGASRLVQAMSAWLVRTRRAPSRHGRDARVYIHTTTAIRKLSTPRFPPPPLSSYRARFTLWSGGSNSPGNSSPSKILLPSGRLFGRGFQRRRNIACGFVREPYSRRDTED